MKLLLTLLALITVLNLTQEEPKIEGKWLMHQVIQADKEVSLEHDPYDERFIELKEDGSFVSEGRPYGKNTGSYVLNKDEQTLFLDSDVGEEDDSHWKYSIKSDTLYWQGYGSEWADAFQIIYTRAE